VSDTPNPDRTARVNPDMKNLCDAVKNACRQDAIEIELSTAEKIVCAVLHTLKDPSSKALKAAGYLKPDHERWARVDLAAIINYILTESGKA
jgi:hypothetical protein